jgi:hypothetical protein
MENGSPFRDVDLLAPEHGIDAGSQAALLRESDEQRHRLIRDPILRIIEIDTRGVHGQPFAARRIAGEQLAEMHGADVSMVLFEGLPGRSPGDLPVASRHGADGHGDSLYPVLSIIMRNAISPGRRVWRGRL